jgi:sensor histidine kinase YesM
VENTTDEDVVHSREGGGTGRGGMGGSGIGLENVRRRLELIYNGRHQLEIRKEEKNYSVLLKIPVE